MPIQPLTHGHQQLLQRLMAAHVMTDSQAQKVYTELEKDMDGAASGLEQCFGQINAKLTKSFGLEIATVNMVVGSKRAKKYHTIINQHADDIAKNAFGFHFNKHELSLIRIIMAHLVEANSSPRKDLINCRAELKEPYKLTLQGAEHCVETLVEEKWLVLTDVQGNGRESMQATLEIGPRSFLELSHMIVDLGYPKEDMPQFLFHHI